MTGPKGVSPGTYNQGMAHTMPNGEAFLRAAAAAEVKAYKQATCAHDWQSDPRLGYSCHRCDAWTLELFRVPVKRA